MSEAVAIPAPAMKLSSGKLWIVPPAALLALLFFYPLALIARQAFLDDSGVANVAEVIRVLHSRFFLNALINTVSISVAATAGCLVVGLVLALILAFVPFPGSGFIARLIDTFIALPTFLVTLAFTFLYGSAGMLNAGLR
ncbi:2-aminoethylphosphonate ABC transporter permease, partial [Mesorhizobium sp. M7A.F.Ca.AU.002.06.1.1]